MCVLVGLLTLVELEYGALLTFFSFNLLMIQLHIGVGDHLPVCIFTKPLILQAMTACHITKHL